MTDSEVSATEAVAGETSSRTIGAVDDFVEQRLKNRTTPRATYRLQFRAPDFGFVAAHDIVAYLDELGISHLYASPLLKARRGSTHGYDVVDHSQLNDELGTDADFTRLTEVLALHQMGLIWDVVPNHMSVGTDQNAWWLDVLMHGPASRYAAYFDIDWQPVQREMEHRLLLPILGDLSGHLLESGALSIVFSLGAFCLQSPNMLLPLDPSTWTRILSPGLPKLSESIGAEHPQLLELQSILFALEHLPERTETTAAQVAERRRETHVIRNRLRLLVQESQPIAQHIATRIARVNGVPGDPHSFDELDRLLSEQAYQLAHWKAGADEINYRRFFDVAELAALCVENPAVFEESHRLLFRLAARGQNQGFRIDHIDGLYNPLAYLWRLQTDYLQVLVSDGATLASPPQDNSELVGTERRPWTEIHRRCLPHGASDDTPSKQQPPGGHSAELSREERCRLPLFVVVEKILGTDEPLPLEWPVQGTTGYDFLNSLNGVFLDPRGLQLLERHYVRFTDQRLDRHETAFQSKRLILDTAMQSELQLLAHRLNRVSKRHRRSRDYTLQAQRAALREIIASFSVYRTYIHDEAVSERDRRVVQRAVAQARRRNPSIDAGVFDFVRDVLLLEQPAGLDDADRAERDLFIGRLQQVTSPVMAKGIEDTEFYRYVPLASINEVGNELDHACTDVGEFHRQNQWRQAHWPQSLLATTTHDTKRSEDVRARLNVLSEIPGLWRQAVQRWTRWNRRLRTEVDGEPAPSRNDEWLFYQTLVGIWPLHRPSEAERRALMARLRLYMEKAVHEAKLRSSWMTPSPHYDAAVQDFVEKSLSMPESSFAEDVARFVNSIVDSGLYSSVAQVLLKLTSPGTPDLYQGQELWDFSLVDPDNRRPVDYPRRSVLLAELRQQVWHGDRRRELCRNLAAQPRDDRLKLFVTWTALQFRRRWLNFLDSQYVPLTARGAKAEHLCAFAWLSSESCRPRVSVVAAPRLVHTLTGSAASRLPCGRAVWEDTEVSVEQLPDIRLRDLMTGRCVHSDDGWLPAASLLDEFPVALVTSDFEE